MTTGVTTEQVRDIFWQALSMPDGDTKTALLEEAVRLADICGNFKLQCGARELLIHAATFGGAPEKALVAYSWMLAQYDRRPEDVDEWQTLWQYKWILDTIANFPQIGKAQILDMLDDMAARYQRAGYSLRPNYLMRARLYKFWDDAEATRCFLKGRELPRDQMSDCAACELNDEVNFFIHAEFDEQALEAAEPIMRGRMKCASIPRNTFAHLLLPLVRLGYLEEAVELHLRGYRLVAESPKGALSNAAEHITFLVLTENFERAVSIFERHLADASAIADALTKFDYYLAGWFLLERLPGASGRTTLKLRLPRTLSVHEESGTYRLETLAAWFLEQCEALAARFDARNESDYFTRQIKETAALKELIAPHPISEAA
ncbi:MAG TPA: hypothetical protein VF656_19285 [Pyrinomonadaceae bacterium]|jgi:hypothetical protein